jgi:hypothetical protein
MNLPNDSIGISDILSYRECPRRMSYGMRRHTGQGTQSDDRTPEAGSWATVYGSAIHEAIAATEDGYDDEAAIKQTWKVYGSKLMPSDLDLLRRDLETYHSRDFPNTRTVASEDDAQVPLLVRDGRQIFFRFKLDRLYERVDAPGTFLHVDYKSSKWAKSADDVHADLQMWAYNFAIHELYPECDRLIQVYDQLRYGQLSTRKTAAQREQMREWLTINVEAILDDDDVRDDGLLKPTYNRWCPWCPVLESCSVVNDLTEFAATRIATLAPTVKEGRRQVVQVEPAKIEEYASVMDKSRVAVRVLERFQDAVKDMLRDMPDEDRYELGYELADRENTVFPPAAIERISEALGPDFFEAAKITKTGLQTVLSDRPDLLAWALEQGVKESKTPVLQRRKEDEPE